MKRTLEGPAALAALAALVALACGPGTAGGPSIDNHMNGTSSQAADTGPDHASAEILARDAETNRAMVKHILVSWRELGGGGRDLDPRAQARSRREADALAKSLLDRVRGGEAIEPLMAQFSEDAGSAKSGEAYEVTPAAQLVFEFKRLGLRLKPGEAAMVRSEFGWHVIKRVE
jgi:parvulin-like peptidyl-prolyl isomerase